MTGLHARGARPIMAILAAALAAGVLAGCGGGETGTEKDPVADVLRTPQPSSSSSTGGSSEDSVATPQGDDAAPSRSGGKPSAGPEAPTVPTDELTPATGSFTDKEKKYLEDRVPQGIDPAAVLVGGKETCRRIARTVDADRSAAVDAIRSGEIADAESVITHLCPEHKGVLEDAKN